MRIWIMKRKINESNTEHTEGRPKGIANVMRLRRIRSYKREKYANIHESENEIISIF